MKETLILVPSWYKLEEKTHKHTKYSHKSCFFLPYSDIKKCREEEFAKGK